MNWKYQNQRLEEEWKQDWKRNRLDQLAVFLGDFPGVDHEDVNYAEVHRENEEKKGDTESISLATPTALDSRETHQRWPMCLA